MTLLNSNHTPSSPLPAHDRFVNVFIYGLSIVLLLVAFYNFTVTLRMGLTQDETDVYMPTTKLMAEGLPIYTTLIDHQPPGVFISSVPFIWLFGNTILAPKMTSVVYSSLYSVAVGFVIFVTTRNWKSTLLALALAAFFASAYAKAYGVNASYFAGVFTVVGLACAVHGSRVKGGGLWAFIGGLAIGLGIMTRPSVIIELPVMFWILYLLCRKWRYLVICGAGAMVGISLICLYFAATSTFKEMFYITVTENLYYGTSGTSSFSLADAFSQRFGYLTTIFIPETLPYLSGLVVAALAALAWIWHSRIRNWLVPAFTLWAILAFLGSALTPSLNIRFFFYVVMPLIALLTLFVERSLRPTVIKVAFVAMALLLLIPAIQPLSNPAALPPKYSTDLSDYQASINFLKKNVSTQDCLLNWGPAQPIYYFTDYRPCARVANEAGMMIKETYDIRQYRAWYFQDILKTEPKYFIQGGVFTGLFPPLVRLIDYRNRKRIFHDDHLMITFYTLDWSSFTKSDANVNGEIDLRGYDMRPRKIITPGQQIDVELYWQVVKTPNKEYQGFLQLVSLDYSHNVASLDVSPTDPYYSTKAWTLPGEIIVGKQYYLTVPHDVAPGKYELVTGLYSFSADNSAVPSQYFNRQTGQPMPFISLGEIEIVPDGPSAIF